MIEELKLIQNDFETLELLSKIEGHDESDSTIEFVRDIQDESEYVEAMLDEDEPESPWQNRLDENLN